MKWTYSVKNKLLASGILLSLCLLVLISNYIDSNHTKNVKAAISTLYADRLIAEEYILKMTSGVYQIKEVIHADLPQANKKSISNNLLLTIKEESNAYLKTKFTTLEKTKADELLSILDAFETIPFDDKKNKLASADQALVILNQLSAIQLEESKQIMANAETLYIAGKTSSQFVFAIIIVILLVLQALVFTSKTLIPNTMPKSPTLN